MATVIEADGTKRSSLPLGYWVQSGGPNGIDTKTLFYAEKRGERNCRRIVDQILINFLGSYMWINIPNLDETHWIPTWQEGKRLMALHGEA